MHMINNTPQNGIISCPGCGTKLRLPEGIGGMTMACPECGQSMGTPFKLGRKRASQGSAPQGVASQKIACLVSRIKMIV
ncbi:hypothetical protein [Desulfovibrio inopinatus]|uniref:hypothetical protein n=1 Tax=Desulfovibrio inopinatus TaxID=102109 RepID=UPI00041782C3|nr:hypothetical protein [Desulfovibrio inopinatus]